MEQVTTYLLVGIIVILSGLLAAFSLYIGKLFLKVHKTQKENTYLKFHVQEKSLEKINATRERSLKIITEATLQAEDILKQAAFLKKDTDQELQMHLDSLAKQQKETLLHSSEAILKEFEELLEQLKIEDINIYKSATKDIERVTLDEVKSFEQQLKQETTGQQKIVEEKIQQAFIHAQQEIDTYKKERLEKITTEIEALLQEVTKDVLGKRLSFQDHQELIREAITKAEEKMMV